MEWVRLGVEILMGVGLITLLTVRSKQRLAKSEADKSETDASFTAFEKASEMAGKYTTSVDSFTEELTKVKIEQAHMRSEVVELKIQLKHAAEEIERLEIENKALKNNEQ
jgi:hypothetical protein